MIGAYRAMPAGKAYLFLGSPNGLSASPISTLSAPDGGRFGQVVAPAGDVNGDGLVDLLIGSDQDRAYLYMNGGAVFGSAPTPTATLTAGSAGGLFGSQLAAAGDLNGDGFDDLVIGAHCDTPLSNTNCGVGRVFVYLGGAAGIASGVPASAVLEGPGNGSGFGTVAGLGDVDNDGFADLGVGAGSAARMFVYRGGSAGIASLAAPSVALDAPGGKLTLFGQAVARVTLRPRYDRSLVR
jgi:hypothetical protein